MGPPRAWKVHPVYGNSEWLCAGSFLGVGAGVGTDLVGPEVPEQDKRLLAKVGEAGVGAAEAFGGLALVPAVEEEFSAGGLVLGGEFAEPGLDLFGPLKLGTDFGVGLGVEHASVLLGPVGQAGEYGGVLQVAPIARGDQVALHVAQGAPDPIAGERREFD